MSTQKKFGVLITSIALTAFPAGMALAANDATGLGIGIGAHVNTDIDLGTHGHIGTTSAHLDSDADVDANAHASSTPWMNGEKNGLERHDATTTPPGHEASSTREHGGFGLHAFFSWLLGLPASTTIGEIQSGIEATSSASTTASVPGIGFWAHLFSFFGIRN